MAEETIKLTLDEDIRLDERLQELGANAPRLSPSDLSDSVSNIEIVKHVSASGSILRWAVITLYNGFSVTGEPSVCVSPENDREETGEKICIENAKRKLWPLLGFRLKDQLYRDSLEKKQDD